MAQPKQRERERKEKEATAEDAPEAPPKWSPPEPLTRRGWLVLGAVVLVVNLPVIHFYLLRGEEPVSAEVPYADDFSDRATISKHYWTSGGGLWRIADGQLLSPGVKNNPLWLKARLPANVAVEFDARSESPEGDIKVEIFGDGLNHQSGYVLIHGGWNNRLSIIARLDEHGRALGKLQEEARALAAQWNLGSSSVVDTGVFQRDTKMRVEANPYPVEIGKTYHWRIERQGSVLRWSIDGKPFMELDDPFPLAGKGHDRFGFSSWEANLYFDNLRVTAL